MKLIKNICQRAFWPIALSLSLILLPLPAYSVTVQEVPNPQEINGTWVSDMAEMFEPETEATLNGLISELEEKYGAEIAVIAVPETAPAPSPKEFARELFNYWGIGKKGEDNGLLLLVSKGDRRVEIETGSGLKTQLPDAKVGAILEKEIAPRFQEGDFDGGILAGTQAMAENLSSLAPSFAQSDRSGFSAQSAPAHNQFLSGLALVLCVMFVPWAFYLLSKKNTQELANARSSKPKDKSKSPGTIYTNDGYDPSVGYHRSWGSSFGGGDSFGGGSSDGGSAGCDF